MFGLLSVLHPAGSALCSLAHKWMKHFAEKILRPQAFNNASSVYASLASSVEKNDMDYGAVTSELPPHRSVLV